MRTTLRTALLFILESCTLLLLPSCLREGDSTLVFPEMTQMTNGRPDENQGRLYLPSPEITIALWDHLEIDGDTISVFVNKQRIVERLGLDGPQNKYSCQVILTKKQNELVVFAHNQGTSGPNTAAISVQCGTFMQERVLESNLSTNASLELIVEGSN